MTRLVIAVFFVLMPLAVAAQQNVDIMDVTVDLYAKRSSQTDFRDFLAAHHVIQSSTQDLRDINNPFVVELLQFLFPDAKGANAEVAAADILASTDQINATGALPFSATDVAKALSSIAAERFQQEIAIQAIGVIDTMLKDPDLDKYVKLFLPRTRDFLKEQHSYRYATFMTTFRQTIEQDFRSVPGGMIEWLEIQSKGSADNSQIKLLLAYIKPLWDFSKHGNVVQAIRECADLTAKQLKEMGYTVPVKSLETLSQLSNVVGFYKKGKIGVSDFSSYPELLTDKTETGYVFRLTLFAVLYKVLGGEEAFRTYIFPIEYVKPDGTWNRDSADHAMIKKLETITAFARDIQVSLTSLSNMLKAEPGKSITPANIASVYLQLIVMVKSTMKTVGVAVDSEPMQRLLVNGKRLGESFQEIAVGNYGSAVSSALKFVQEYVPTDSEKLKHLHELTTILISIMEAKDGEELQKVLESVVLPAQSWRMKSDAGVACFLNMYAGARLAFNGDVCGSALGFTTPVGLSLSFGTRNSCFSSISFFASIIDVGAFTMYQLSADAGTGALPEVTWENIFAPGGHLQVGFGKTPFLLDLGIQYGPELRSASEVDGDVTYDKYPAHWKWTIGLCVDIPLFVLGYSKRDP